MMCVELLPALDRELDGKTRHAMRDSRRCQERAAAARISKSTRRWGPPSAKIFREKLRD
jgi:hypothetical protein